MTKDKKIKKSETEYSEKWFNRFYWYVVIGTLTLGAFQHFYLKPEVARQRQAQKIERREEKEKAGKYKAYDPKDFYSKNMIYEPNKPNKSSDLEDKTKYWGRK